MLSVLIVDDHFVARYGVKETLKEEFRDITFGEVATAASALFEVAKQSWTVIVLDISMPDGNGFQVLEEILKRSPQARVLVFSMHSETQYAVRALRMGACGYLTKDAGRTELLAAFRNVLAGKKYVKASLIRNVDAELESAYDVKPDMLSRRERTVLLALAAGKRISTIALELKLSEKTVTTYRRRIMDKLHLQSNADLVYYVIDHKIS